MMREHVVELDAKSRLRTAPGTGHNRWHEDIPPILEVAPGDQVVMDVRDGFDGQVMPGSPSSDLACVSFGANHPLTGPVFVEGAEPGDLLQVEILELDPDPREGVGFTAVVPGFGLLRQRFSEPYVAHWSFHADGYAESEEVPGVRIPGEPFCGIIGVAPDRTLRLEVTAREARLANAGATISLPDPAEAIPEDERIAREGLRTIPPRENGGNLDVKLLTAGATAFLPVFVPGALFSVGDLHYAQGDGEVCGSAIEMSGRVRLRLDVRKGEAIRGRVRGLQVVTPRPASGAGGATGRRFVTTGICVEDGVNHHEDATVAARRAIDHMVDHLVASGFDERQAYVICSAAVDLSISEAVDVPNVIVSASLPLDIFTAEDVAHAVGRSAP